jgi:hypothetical protein
MLPGGQSSGDWVHIKPTGGSAVKESYGRKDVYDMVYKKSAYYGLVSDNNIRYLDPRKEKMNRERMQEAVYVAGILTENPTLEIDYSMLYDEAATRSLRKKLEKLIEKTEKFHKSIKGSYHPFTCGFWTASAQHPAIGEILWNAGKIHAVKHKGDDTVSVASWAGDMQYFKGGCVVFNDRNAKDQNGGFTHQEAYKYKPSQSRALYFLLNILSYAKNCGELV